MKETDVDHMGQEDIACMMMQNCFLDTTLKANLVAVKNLTLAAFNDIIKSHEAGKKAASLTASANAMRSKGEIKGNLGNNLVMEKEIRFPMLSKNVARNSWENASVVAKLIT